MSAGIQQSVFGFCCVIVTCSELLRAVTCMFLFCPHQSDGRFICRRGAEEFQLVTAAIHVDVSRSWALSRMVFAALRTIYRRVFNNVTSDVIR